MSRIPDFQHPPLIKGGQGRTSLETWNNAKALIPRRWPGLFRLLTIALVISAFLLAMHQLRKHYSTPTKKTTSHVTP